MISFNDLLNHIERVWLSLAKFYC